MKCNKCGQDNPTGSKFCCGCGSKLEKLCPKCHQPVMENARFCPQCGENLAGEPAAILNMDGNVIAGDVHNVVNIIQNNENASKDLRCHECGEFIPAAHQQTSTCYRCGHHFCSKHLSGNFCASCLTEEQLRAFEFVKLDNNKYAVTKLKNPRTLKVAIPSSVESIEDEAFMGTDLIEVALPESLLKIGDRAFKDCTDLNQINFPKSLSIIGNQAFMNCESLSVFPRFRTRIGTDAFTGTKYEKDLTPPIAQNAAIPDLPQIVAGTNVCHKMYGVGKVTKIDTAEKIVFINFGSGELKFMYPLAFERGLLVIEPPQTHTNSPSANGETRSASSPTDMRVLEIHHYATAGAAQELWVSVDNSEIYKIWSGKHLTLQVKGETHTIQTRNPMKRNTYQIKVPEKGLRFFIHGRAFTNEIKTETLS